MTRIPSKVTAVIVSNRPQRCRDIIAFFAEAEVPSILVVDDPASFEIIKSEFPAIRLIGSRSRNFAYLRNLGAFHALSDYVFVVADDEIVDEQARAFLRGDSFDSPGYRFRINATFAGIEIKWWRRTETRMYKRFAAQFVYPVHERLRLKGRSRLAPGSITNHAYRDLAHFWAKAERTIPLERRSLRTLSYRLAAPTVQYLFQGGLLDGRLGLGLLLAYYEYAIRILKVPPAGFPKPTYDRVLTLLDRYSSRMDMAEAHYLNTRISDLRALPRSSADIAEEIEQLLSALQPWT